jgi:4-amino-4-deoxy-L-arabinose transferase-like glycosyltransferase
MVLRNILPYDMIENLYWGKELQPGYSKHPPLFAWISFFFYKLSFSRPESLYVLTQLNLSLGLFFIFKTSELIFENKRKSYAAVLIFLASAAAVFGNEKFNASTILMSLFPSMFYFFLRLIKFNRKKDAIALGVASALAFLGKYFALLYLGCMGLFLIANRECRHILKTPQPYLAVATFLLCIGWHLSWLWDNDFVAVKYALGKSIDAQRDFFAPFNFLLMQSIFFSTSLWAFRHSYASKMNFFPKMNGNFSTEEKFIIFISIAPGAILFFASLVTGMRIGSFWGTNMLMMLGTYLLTINPREPNYDKLFVFARRISCFFAVALFVKLAIARYFLCHYDPTNALDTTKIAALVDHDWRRCFGNQKMTILKTDKATAELHIRLQDSPSSYNIEHNDLFHIYDKYPMDANLAVVFLCARNDGQTEHFKKFYGKSILFDSMTHLIDDYAVYYAFLNVKNNRKTTRK